MSTAKATASRSCDTPLTPSGSRITSGPTDSATPMESPPAMAPPRWPMPPTTAALKALIPGRKPVVWITLRNKIPHKMPANPAIAPPNANTFTMVRLTLMPISAAISASSATARMALPLLVRSTK